MEGAASCKAERDRARDYRSCFKLVIRCNLRIALDRAIDRHISVGPSRSTLAKMMHFYWPSLEAFTAAHSRCVLERTKYKSNTFYPNLGTVGPLACSPDAVTGRGISSRHDGRGHQHSVAGIAVFSAVVIFGPLQSPPWLFCTLRRQSSYQRPN